MNNTIEKIGLRWSLVTLLLLGAYFIIMKLLGLIHIPELRVLNALIMCYGVFQSVKDAKANLDDFNYFKGFGTGALTAFSAAFVYSVFGVLYLQFINPDFLTDIISKEPLGFFMNQYSASIQIFIEGAASGILFSYSSLQWLRTPYLAGGN